MRRTAAILLVLYCLFIARLTLFDPSAGSAVFNLADYWAAFLSGGRLDWSQTEILANIALFVPAGFLVALVTLRPALAIGLCVLGSVWIELWQLLLLPTRVPSLADIQHNGAGAVLGALMAWVVLVPRREPDMLT